MEFGILFHSHPNHVTEPYPHRDVHARVSRRVAAANRLVTDTALRTTIRTVASCRTSSPTWAICTATSRSASERPHGFLPLFEPVRVVDVLAFVRYPVGGA